MYLGKGWTEIRRPQRKPGPDTKGRINPANLTAGLAIEGSRIAFLRMRVFLKSPVLENGTPGSVRGASGNRCPYRFLQGESPCQVRVNHPPVLSVALVEEVLHGLNETIEAYTGNHVDRRGADPPQSLIQPRE